MPYTFYIRDHWIDETIHEVGEIHRVKYDHHDGYVEIMDHEDPTFEIASREFGYSIDSECLNFRQLVSNAGIVRALTSMSIFPGSILIRIAAAWARDVAQSLDECGQRREEFADGTPFTAVGALDLTLKYLKKYINKDPEEIYNSDRFGRMSPEDDVSEMIPAFIFWNIMNQTTNQTDDQAILNALYAVQDIVGACSWYPALGASANHYVEVEKRVIDSVAYASKARDIWLTRLRSSGQIDEFDTFFKSKSEFERRLREAAKITKKYQREL